MNTDALSHKKQDDILQQELTHLKEGRIGGCENDIAVALQTGHEGSFRSRTLHCRIQEPAFRRCAIQIACVRRYRRILSLEGMLAETSTMSCGSVYLPQSRLYRCAEDGRKVSYVLRKSNPHCTSKLS